MEKLIDNILPLLGPYLHPDDRAKDYVTCGNQYEWYYTYAKIKKPHSILEIGVSRGYSIISMCLAHPPARVFLIDSMLDGIDPYLASCKLRKMRMMDLTYVIAKSSDAYDNVKGLYDIIHIDGDHSDEGLYSDLRYLKYLANDGWIIVDDVGDLNTLWQTCVKFSGENDLSIEKVDSFRGHAILRRN